MRESLQAIYEKFSGTAVYIVGGGPSIKDVNIDILRGKNTIAINKSLELLQDASCLYWCDDNWASNNYKALDAHSCQYRFASRHNAEMYIKKDIKGTAGSTILRHTGDYGFDANSDNVMGNNSGTQAINFAINMGARTIILLGYDMKFKNRKSHWHGGHGLPMKEDVYDKLFVPSTDALAEKIKRIPTTTVVNCTKNSALKCFNVGNLEDYI